MTIRIIQGNCIAVMASLPECSVDAIVTDPPYHLTTGKKGGSGPASVNLDSPYGRARIGTGFMGMKWDGGDVAFRPETWAAVLRVLKPGGHLLAFSGTRTYHRMVCAVEDAGFEIRDQIGWLFGTGFPKSLDVSKAIDSRMDWAPLKLLQGKVRAARQALGISQSEAARRMGLIGESETLGGGGFMWFETGMRVPTREQYPALKVALQLDDTCDAAFESAEREVIGRHTVSAGGQNMRAGIGGGDEALPPGEITAPATEAAKRWAGWGTALKPAWEPIVLARRPLVGTVAANVLEHGTGALNIDGCRVGDEVRVASFTSLAACHGNALGAAGTAAQRRGTQGEPKEYVGRWPANILHDGSDEVLAAFPDAPGQKADVTGNEPSEKTAGIFGPMKRAGEASGDSENAGAVGFKMKPGMRRGDTSSAARFFWSPKASRHDRNDGMQCNCEELWGNEDREASTQPATGTQAPRATTGSTKADASGWPTSSSGSGTTDLFQQDTKSTTLTTTSSTTPQETSQPLTPPPTSGFTADANYGPASGGSHASSAASSNPSTQSTGTSARKGGRSTDGAGHATSPESSPTKRSDARCERCGQLMRSTHPTVKPTELMRYLCRLITPPGGTVLDPFMGSGSTLKASELEGFSAIGIELDPEYVEIARRRIAADAPLFADVKVER